MATIALPLASPAATAEVAEKGPSTSFGRIQKQIDQSLSRRKVLSDELKALQREEEQISSRLIDLAARIQAREAMITASERRIAVLDQRLAKLRKQLAERRETLTELLAGLQRLERNRPPPLATRPDDAVGAIRGAMLFGAVVPALNAETAALARTLAELDSLRARQIVEQSDLRVHLSKLDLAHKEIAELQVRKASLIERTGEDLKSEGKRADQLAGRAKSLRQLMNALASDRRRRKIDEIARAAAKKQKLQPAVRKFTSLRGHLEYPAQGRLVRRFGDRDGLGNRSKGVFIATRRKGQVTAPVGGKIEYAGDFRSYGKLLILDVGEGYHVLLAGLVMLTAETGQIVRAGEPIGRMGMTSARGTLIGGKLQSNKPVLYVEFRTSGRAIDSSPWWIGNRKEARR